MSRTTLEDLRRTASQWTGDLEAADDLLVALGLPELLHQGEVLARVLVAADGFHPVARFFAEGSEERQVIEGVLAEQPGSW
jgi:hypothetical protein